MQRTVVKCNGKSIGAGGRIISEHSMPCQPVIPLSRSLSLSLSLALSLSLCVYPAGEGHSDHECDVGEHKASCQQVRAAKRKRSLRIVPGSIRKELLRGIKSVQPASAFLVQARDEPGGAGKRSSATATGYPKPRNHRQRNDFLWT